MVHGIDDAQNTFRRQRTGSVAHCAATTSSPRSIDVTAMCLPKGAIRATGWRNGWIATPATIGATVAQCTSQTLVLEYCGAPLALAVPAYTLKAE